MGLLRRLLPSRVRGVVILALAGMGVVGCRTCPKGDPAPVQDAPCQSHECYPAVEAATADGLAASLAASSSVPPACPRPLNVLALSGGVGGAPFTAGVLVGWSKASTRPMFDVVSGISSGSLIGGYAFLGPKYDPELRRLILSLKTSDLFKFRPLSSMICDGAFGSAEPAKRLIDRVFNDEFVTDLRQAHAEGRRFFVGTMSLQTKRLVTWDLGAIASSGRPDAGDLVRKVLLAAISWPGFFPPVEFDVEVNGHCYHEAHCDAGAAAMVFVRFGALPGCPGRCAPIRLGSLAGSHLYVLTSRKLFSDPEPVPEHAISRLSLSVSAIFEALTRADIARLYSFCALSGMRFNLLALPMDYHGKPPSLKCLFPREAPQLFELGYQMGSNGPCWRHTPPGAEPGEESVPRDGTHIKPCCGAKP